MEKRLTNEYSYCQRGKEYDQEMIWQLNRIHKALTCEGIEEPEYTSIIERLEYEDFGVYDTYDLYRLYYDDNGILRKSIHPVDREGFGCSWGFTYMPGEHCLLSVRLFDAQGKLIRWCDAAQSVIFDRYWGNFSEHPYVSIMRSTYRDGVRKEEHFHISENNLFSEKMPPEPVQEKLEEVRGDDRAVTIDWYCDPKNIKSGDRFKYTKYTVIKCARKYLKKICIPIEYDPEKARMVYRRGDDTFYVEGFGTVEPSFAYCDSSLRNLVIGPNCVAIGKRAFQECSNLETVEFVPGDLESIETEAFADCSGLKKVTLPDGLEKIGEKAFSNCYGLTAVSIPEGVEEIGREAFEYCVELEELVIPDSVTEIGWNAFMGVPHIIYHGPAQSGDNWGALSRN